MDVVSSDSISTTARRVACRDARSRDRRSRSLTSAKASSSSRYVKRAQYRSTRSSGSSNSHCVAWNSVRNALKRSSSHASQCRDGWISRKAPSCSRRLNAASGCASRKIRSNSCRMRSPLTLFSNGRASEIRASLRSSSRKPSRASKRAARRMRVGSSTKLRLCRTRMMPSSKSARPP